MKCSFCSSNIPDGSELCPECGMIISLDGAEQEEVSIPGYVPNIFGSEPIKAPEVTQQDTPVEETVIEVPEYEPEKIILSDEASTESEQENTAASEEKELSAAEEEYAFDEAAEQLEEEQPEESDSQVAEAQESYEAETPVQAEEAPSEEFAPPEYDPDSQSEYADKAEYEDISSVSSETAEEYEAFADEAEVEESFVAYEEQEEVEVITPVIVPVEDEQETYARQENEEESEQEELEEVDGDDDDTYIGNGKKGTVPKVIALCLLLVCLVVAGGYIVKKVVPVKPDNTTDTGVAVVNTTKPSDKGDADKTTVADETTESELTTEEDVSGEKLTTEPSTEGTTEPLTEGTTEPSTEGTTKPTTTRPSTTKPTTTRPTTTRPSTTKPTTTKPNTTVDPYGINGAAKIQKPSKYLSESYLGYTTKRVDMMGGPSSSSDWVQALGKGAEVKVLAKEKGYCYIYSTRFGTYGWVASSNVSEERPEAGTTTTNKNTVQPDKSGSGETKYTTYSLNLRKGPGKDYAVIKTVPINYPVKIIGYKSGVSGWAYVTDLTTGINGWVATEYLK